MARARGFAGFVGLGKETSWGGAASLTRYLRIRSESLTHSKETQFDQALGSVHRRGPFDGKIGGAGDIVTNLQYNGLELLFYNLMGYNPTPTGSPTATWTFSTNAGAASAFPTGLTVSVNRDLAKMVFTGNKVVGAKFEFPANEIPKATWSLVGKGLSSSSDTCDTPTYPSPEVNVLPGEGVLKFDSPTSGSARTCKAHSVTVKNLGAFDDYSPGSNLLVEPVRTGFEVAAEATLWFTTRADYTLFTASSVVNYLLVCTSATSPYTMTFTMPKSKITPSAEPNVTGAGLIEMPAKLEGYFDDTTDPLVITVVNTMAAAL